MKREERTERMSNNMCNNGVRKNKSLLARVLVEKFFFIAHCSLLIAILFSCWLEGDIDEFLGLGKEIEIEMVSIPAGNFLMGSPADEIGRFSDEGPQRQVTLNAFKMGKYQVTQEQWRAVMRGNANGISLNPSYFHGGSGREPASREVQARRPVEQVSWYEALVFCNRFSIIEGLNPVYRIRGSTNPADWGTVPESSSSIWNDVIVVTGSTGYRLPTEAQWEYACRAGTATAFNDGATQDWKNSAAVGLLAWCSSNSGSRTHEVGKKAPNAWGLYDMHGNVWEWCWDWSGTYPNIAQTNPLGASSGSFRVLRGGSWNIIARDVRSAFRYSYNPSNIHHFLGFRVVLPE